MSLVEDEASCAAIRRDETRMSITSSHFSLLNIRNMPSVSNDKITVGKHSSGKSLVPPVPPVAEEPAEPLNQIQQLIEKKIRNLEKRKVSSQSHALSVTRI